jgi:prepilin-type N-terminal cleavage/methylation domain-containing protein
VTTDRNAFTLLELLTVIAIIAILAVFLFPVVVLSKGEAKKTACLSNFAEVGRAVAMYTTDYNDTFMPVNYQPDAVPNSRNDRTWVQLVLPYVANFGVFFCPSDTSDKPRLDSTFDEDLVPGDTDAQYYTASQHTNVGYNFQYLAPIVRMDRAWVSMPKIASSVEQPSDTILFADSAWSVHDGVPSGGGSWLVVPPCRYESAADGTLIDTFTNRIGTGQVFTTIDGWTVNSDSTVQYGGAWPWHFNHVNVAMTDGRVKSMSLGELERGCDVQNGWSGLIQDPTVYAWDPKFDALTR